jgi:hypothetical protein
VKGFYDVDIVIRTTVWADSKEEAQTEAEECLNDIVQFTDVADIVVQATNYPHLGDSEVPWGSTEGETIGQLRGKSRDAEQWVDLFEMSIEGTGDGTPFRFHKGEDPLGDSDPPHEYLLTYGPNGEPIDPHSCLVVNRKTGAMARGPHDGQEILLLETPPGVMLLLSAKEASC